MAGESPASILYDSEGNPVLVSVEGTTYAISSRDEEQVELLGSILIELRKLNTYFAIILDQELDDSDVEES